MSDGNSSLPAANSLIVGITGHRKLRKSELPTLQAQVKAFLQDLQARKIDAYLITEGELANGILLGVFPQLAAVAGVAEKVRAAGYEPQVRKLPRVYQEHWLRVAEKSQRLLDDDLLGRLGRDFSNLKHRLISCAGVAQQ